MGKRTIVFDDIDDSLDADRTVTFSIDREAYEIDLNEKNIDKLRKALDPFIEAGRRAAGGSRVAKASGPKKIANPELDAIRQWATKNGYHVSDKGRIPVDIADAYKTAHAEPVKAATTKAPAAKTSAKAANDPAFSAV